MTFDLQPFLKSELLSLRPLKEDDWEGLYTVASDPLIWEQHPQKDRYQRPIFRSFFDSGIKSGGALVALDTKTGQILGSSRYRSWNSEEKSIVIGWTFLSRACWGRGYNRAMKELMLDHAFRFADTVLFSVGESNWRSRKAVEKIGGEFVKTIEEKLADCSPNPSVLYQISKAKGMR
jgi:RimJ/RimL family protein N-acetyltransferase